MAVPPGTFASDQPNRADNIGPWKWPLFFRQITNRTSTKRTAVEVKHLPSRRTSIACFELDIFFGGNAIRGGGVEISRTCCSRCHRLRCSKPASRGRRSSGSSNSSSNGSRPSSGSGSISCYCFSCDHHCLRRCCRSCRCCLFCCFCWCWCWRFSYNLHQRKMHFTVIFQRVGLQMSLSAGTGSATYEIATVRSIYTGPGDISSWFLVVSWVDSAPLSQRENWSANIFRNEKKIIVDVVKDFNYWLIVVYSVLCSEITLWFVSRAVIRAVLAAFLSCPPVCYLHFIFFVCFMSN